MAEWQTPKTDWHGERDSEGVYTGDRFNAKDFNRIHQNIAHLRELADTLYSNLPTLAVIKTAQVGDFVYADEINQIESNFERLQRATFEIDYGDTPEYHDNSPFIDYRELNRLEGAILDTYNRLQNQYQGRRTFSWAFGTKGGEL